MARSTKKTTTSTRSTKAAKPALAVVSNDAPTAQDEALEPVALAAEAVEAGPESEVEETSGDAPVVLIKKKEFVERVVAVSGAKKAVARDLSEAVLRVLGEALSNGESLILPPLGKLRVAKHIDRTGAEVLQIKLKRSTGEADAKNPKKTEDAPLAEAED